MRSNGRRDEDDRARLKAETGGRRRAATSRASPGPLSEAFMDGALATHLPWSGPRRFERVLINFL